MTEIAVYTTKDKKEGLARLLIDRYEVQEPRYVKSRSKTKIFGKANKPHKDNISIYITHRQ